MTAPRFVIPKVNLLDEAIFNKQRRNISDEFFSKKATIRKHLISVVSILNHWRNVESQHYVISDVSVIPQPYSSDQLI
jgi:hypothetical protein